MISAAATIVQLCYKDDGSELEVAETMRMT